LQIFVRLTGTARYVPSQTQESVLADIRKKLDNLETEFPGLIAKVFSEQSQSGRPLMKPFEVSKKSRIVTATNKAYKKIRKKPT
jgi:hypothetical protein